MALHTSPTLSYVRPDTSTKEMCEVIFSMHLELYIMFKVIKIENLGCLHTLDELSMSQKGYHPLFVLLHHN